MNRREWVTLPQLLKARPCLTERYVRTLVFEKRIPHYKPGSGRLMFELGEIDAWIEDSKVPVAS